MLIPGASSDIEEPRDPRSQPVRITLIGPAFPWRGGIPLLTNELAHRLAAHGHTVQVRTWTRQGPARLLPAELHPLAQPEAEVYPTVREPLSWRNPLDWARTGRRAAAARRPVRTQCSGLRQDSGSRTVG